MRTREEIHKDAAKTANVDVDSASVAFAALTLEALLDIRDLLLQGNTDRQTTALTSPKDSH